MTSGNKKFLAVFQTAAFVAVFAALSIFLGFNWETNDDPAFARLLSVQGNDYAVFIWRILSIVISRFYLHFPQIQWWAVFTIGGIFAASFAIIYVIHMRYPKLPAALISIALLTFTWYVGLYKMNFTRTAAIIAVAGCLLIADSAFSSKEKRIPIGEFLIGLFFLLLGASFRRASAMLALAFLAMIGLVRFLRDNLSLRMCWIKDHLRQIILLGVAAVVFFGASFVHGMILTPEQKAFERYNAARSNLQDYINCYPPYSEAEELYTSLSLTKEAVNLLFDWGSEDTELFGVETMEAIGELKTADTPVNLGSIIIANKVPILLVVAYAVLLSLQRKKNILADRLLLDTAVLMLLYLSFGGRLPERVYMSIVFMMACAWVFVAGEDLPVYQKMQTQEQLLQTSVGTSKWEYNRKSLLAGLLVALDLLAITSIYPSMRNQYQTGTPQKIEYSRMILDQIHEDSEHAYLFDVFAQPPSQSEAFGFWEAIPADYCLNRFSLGGWNARLPYRVALLESYGIENPMRSLYENPKVYTLYSARVLAHLRQYYDSSICVSQVKSIGNYNFVQYSAFVDHSSAPVMDDQVSLAALYYSDSGNHPGWYFRVKLQEEASALEERELFCNVLVGESWRSYRLALDGTVASGYFWELGSDFDFAAAQAVIVEKLPDGTLASYGIDW